LKLVLANDMTKASEMVDTARRQYHDQVHRSTGVRCKKWQPCVQMTSLELICFLVCA
jgi:hypothetical protein